MPRPLRPDLPGIPQHVVQRGNDRQPCFFPDADYLCYRSELRHMARREGCVVHAYVLMTNHVHLPLTPLRPGAVGRTMQALGRRYVRCVNVAYRRTRRDCRRIDVLDWNPRARCFRSRQSPNREN